MVAVDTLAAAAADLAVLAAAVLVEAELAGIGKQIKNPFRRLFYLLAFLPSGSID